MSPRQRAPRMGIAFAAALGLVCWLGCGAGDVDQDGAEQAPDRSMVQAARDVTAERVATTDGAPVVTDVSIEPESPRLGASLRAFASAADPDGDVLEYRYTWRGEDGRVLGERRELETGLLDAGGEGDADEWIELEVVAFDGEHESEPARASVRLEPRASGLEAVWIEPATDVKAGDRLRAEVVVGEALDRSDVEFDWLVNGESSGEDADELSTEGLAVGDRIELVAFAVGTDGRSRTRKSAAVVVAPGAPPEIRSEPAVTWQDGEFQYRLEAVSPSAGAVLRYSLLEGPEGMTVDAETGLVRWRPTGEQRGSFVVDVKVEDPWGMGAAQRFEIDVAAEAGTSRESDDPAPAAPR